MHVFKENFKILMGTVIEQVWSNNVFGGCLDRTIIGQNRWGCIREIKEVDDEYANNDSMTHSNVKPLVKQNGSNNLVAKPTIQIEDRKIIGVINQSNEDSMLTLNKRTTSFDSLEYDEIEAEESVNDRRGLKIEVLGYSDEAVLSESYKKMMYKNQQL